MHLYVFLHREHDSVLWILFEVFELRELFSRQDVMFLSHPYFRSSAEVLQQIEVQREVVLRIALLEYSLWIHFTPFLLKYSSIAARMSAAIGAIVFLLSASSF